MTETRDDTVTWLTQEAYDRLKAELDHLSGTGRIEIAKKIEAARWRATSRRTAAITPPRTSRASWRPGSSQLTNILDSSRVGTAPRTDGVVGPGMTVTIRFAGR